MTRWNRALVALALTSALTFVSVPGASAAVPGRAGRAVRVPAVKAAVGSWLEDLLDRLLDPFGVRIDPNGNE
jgi:hypothetical protein